MALRGRASIRRVIRWIRNYFILTRGKTARKGGFCLVSVPIQRAGCFAYKFLERHHVGEAHLGVPLSRVALVANNLGKATGSVEGARKRLCMVAQATEARPQGRP
jgi:hypothetical protein